jgi:hypothetical protein
MADVLFVAILIAFFGVAFALVKACDRIIGPDDRTAIDAEQDNQQEQLAA